MGDVLKFPAGPGAYWSGFRAEVEPRLLAEGYPPEVVARVLSRLEKFCCRLVDQNGWGFSLNLSPYVPAEKVPETVAAVREEVRGMVYGIVADAMAAAMFTFLEMESS